jgi:hypothetical protein
VGGCSEQIDAGGVRVKAELKTKGKLEEQLRTILYDTDNLREMVKKAQKKPVMEGVEVSSFAGCSCSTERQKERQRNRQKERQKERQRNRQKERQRNRQRNRNRQKERQRNRQR